MSNITPVRIQRSRTKKQISPNDLPIVYVGRPTKFGNPFRIDGDMIMVDARHRRSILSNWVLYGNQNKNFEGGGFCTIDVVNIYLDLILDLDSHEIEPEIRQKFSWIRNNIGSLKGKNLSCWCKEGECCHADVLLKLANK